MKYNCYHYPEKNKVVISSSEEKVCFDEINPNDLRIDLAKKEVEKIYDFFKFITVHAILHNDHLIEIDYSSITNEKFFKDDSFVKLRGLFSDLIVIAHDTFKEIKNN